jgi:hypothetical protein
MKSLLGYFYAKIKGSHEDIVSEGLCYILNDSEIANGTIRQIIHHDTGINLPALNFETQQSGELLERPDLSGYDEDQIERCTIEAKFWAGLTDNQPCSYLSRLGKNCVLLFICPDLRTQSLWGELKRKLNNESILFIDDSKYIIKLSDDKYLLLKTWKQVVHAIRTSLVQGQQSTSDIDQIDGLCCTVDDNSFLPISSNDMSPSIPKHLISYCDVIDKTIDKLVYENIVIIKGLKSTGQRWGYTRYFISGCWGFALEVNYEYWAQECDTPIWLSVKEAFNNTNWQVNAKVIQSVKSTGMKYLKKNKTPYFPIYLMLDSLEEEVIMQLTNEIINLIRKLNAKNSLV